MARARLRASVMRGISLGSAGLRAIASASSPSASHPRIRPTSTRTPCRARRPAASLSAVAIGWALGLPDELLRSLAPKSVTAPVAMGIAEQLGGIPALAAVFAVLTGLVGAISGKYLFDAIGGLSMPARGFALGTASHGIGAARALQVDADAGAYAGLALGVQVVLAALLMPLLARAF